MDTGYEERYMLLRANFTKLVGVNVCEAGHGEGRKEAEPALGASPGGVAF
jgi:hypothetical protein